MWSFEKHYLIGSCCLISDDHTSFYTTTSGSSGTPLKIPWKHTDYIRSMIALWRVRRRYGITSSDFYLTCHVGHDLNLSKKNDKIIISKNFLSLSKACYSNDTMQYYMHYIKMFTPKWILAQPSFVYYIGDYIRKCDPHLADSFKYIELVGELLLPDILIRIKEYFPNAQVVNMYGMQEFNGVLFEENGRMKPLYDNVYVEIVRDDGVLCNINEEGNVVVTGLKNTAFPLIRYKTGDRGKQVMANGEIYYVLTQGRSNDELVYNGYHIDGAIFFLIINRYNNTHTHTISKFQTVFDGGVLLYKVFSFDQLPPEELIAHDLKNLFESLTNISFKVRVEILSGENCICETSKIKYFINKSL